MRKQRFFKPMYKSAMQCNRNRHGNTVAKTNKKTMTKESKNKIKQKMWQIVKPSYFQTRHTSYAFHVFKSNFVIFNKVYSL